MEDFEKNLLKMRKTNRTVPTVLLIAAAFFLLFGFFCIPRKDRPFDPTSGGYASLNIVYVMGPFAEQTSDGRTVKKYYVAHRSWTALDGRKLIFTVIRYAWEKNVKKTAVIGTAMWK